MMGFKLWPLVALVQGVAKLSSTPHSRSFTALCGKRAFLEANKCQGHGLESHRFQN